MNQKSTSLVTFGCNNFLCFFFCSSRSHSYVICKNVIPSLNTFIIFLLLPYIHAVILFVRGILHAFATLSNHLNRYTVVLYFCFFFSRSLFIPQNETFSAVSFIFETIVSSCQKTNFPIFSDGNCKQRKRNI